MYTRSSVLTGQSLTLRVVFTDDAGNLVDTDALPAVHIYDESIDPDVIQAEADAQVFTNALEGPLTPTKLSTGYYELVYAVPSGSNAGVWSDVWTGAIDTVTQSNIFTFTVDVNAIVTIQQLKDNQIVIVELDSTIANTGGTLTLGIDQVLSFTTKYKPLYASPEMVRLEVGPFIGFIPDNTLALMIHWSSKEADFIAKPARCNASDFEFARTKFVVFDAALKALSLPGASNLSSVGAAGGSNSKKLGDLAITKGGSSVMTTSSGVDVDTLNYLRDQRDEWWRVTNAGGCIVPGQGFAPVTAIRGLNDPDRRNSGRLWANPETTHYAQPGANSKVRRHGTHRGKFMFTEYRRQGRRGKRR